MKLRQFNVAPKSSYGEDKDKYIASICVEGDNSWDPSIKFELTPEQIEPILGIIHGAVVKNLDQSVTDFRAAVMAEYAPVLEGQTVQQIEAE